MPVSQKRKRQNVEKVQRWRDRQKVDKAKWDRMIEDNLDIVLSGKHGITLKIEPTAYSLDFVWGGPQAEYDRVEAYCNSQGYSYSAVQNGMEQLVLRRTEEARKRRELVKGMTAEGFRKTVFDGGIPTVEEVDGKVVVTWEFTEDARRLLELYAEREHTDLETLIEDVNREWLVKQGYRDIK